MSGPDIIASIFVSSWVKTLCEGENAILDEESALPTILFLMTMSTFIMGVIWFAIGHYHMTKVVEYLPAPLVCGFLSCIGWKVVKYATKVSSGSSWYAADDGEYLRKRAAREWSTVVDISTKPPSFKLVPLSSPRSPLSKTPKHVIF